KTRIKISIDRQSDANFLRLFSNDFYSVLTRRSRSSVSISSSLANLKFSASAMQNDTYYTFADRATFIRYLPQIKLSLNHQKIWKLPGYLSIDTSYATINRVGESYEEDGETFRTDVSSTRMSVNPSYTLNLLKLPWLNATLSLKSKNTFYPRSQDPVTKVIVDEPLHLGYQTANVTVKGPIFSKIFESRKSKLKHLIEPKIIFRYATKVPDEDRDRLIKVDYFDYPLYSYVGFALTTRLLYKQNKQSASPREILSYTVQQDYYFDASLASRGRKLEGEYPEFSQLKNTLRLRPHKNFTMDASLLYNHYLNKFTRVRLSVGYKKTDSIINGNFFYNNYINQYRPDYELNRETIGGSLNIGHPRFPLRFDSNVNYDITDKQFRLGSFMLIYDYQCIQFRGELKLFKYTERVETQFNIGVSFGNLGMVKDILGIDK
ncbi:MAG: LPS-assembly protein LptD, partial [bacterium]|nr:LPS-assembly protein LptD [bacterium]